VSFNIATANGSAVAGSDYVAASSNGLTIPAGQVSTTFNVTINGDTSVESNETFSVNLSNPVGGTISDAQGIGTITNDDTASSLSIGDVSISEGNSGTKVATFTVTLDKAAATAVTYDITTNTNGTATSETDYVPSGLASQSIPVGQTSKTFAVTIIGDTAIEGNETFGVDVSNVVGATVGDGSALGTITNDDAPTMSIADVLITEGNSGTQLATFTVKLSQANTVPVTYDIATANSSAAAGTDYVASSLTGETIAAGQTSKTFTVTVNGDTVQEANENFLVNLSNVVGASITDTQAIGTIINDEGPTLSIGDVSIIEGNTGNPVATFTVTLSQAAATVVNFNVATGTAGSATSGVDFVGFTPTAQSIPAGQTSKTISITINSDTAIEANETFGVNLSGAVGATIADSQGICTIVNDDGPTLSIVDSSVVEGNSGQQAMNFTVRLSQAAATNVTFNAAMANGSAVAGTDYVATTQTGLLIPAGQLSKSFSVLVNSDSAVEANETLLVNLTGSTGASILDSQATGTIINDDGPTLSVSDVQITEGNSGTQVATFTISLSQPAATAVTYNITTGTAGTATAGSDFVLRTLIGETIPAGQTSRTFAVTINGDTTIEPNENFGGNVSSVVGATVFDGQGICTIVNDD
jgi:hypothetical protein